MDSLRLRKESLSIFFNGAPPQSPSPKKKDSRFRGVRKRPGGRFAAEIHIPLKKKSRWLGTFSTAEEAARAYDKVARAIHGPTAKTNFVYADFSGIQPPPLLTLPRSSGEVPGRKLEYRRSPVYISCEMVGVPLLCWEYKGYKLEDAGRVGTSQGEEKKVVRERKEPLLFDLNKPAPFF